MVPGSDPPGPSSRLGYNTFEEKHGRGYSTPWSTEHKTTSGSLRALIASFSDAMVLNTCTMLGVALISVFQKSWVISAGVVGLFSGASSFSGAEWISTTLQNEAEAKELKNEAEHLRLHPQEEEAHLRLVLQREWGLSQRTSDLINRDVRAQDEMRFRLHTRLEFGLDVDEPRIHPCTSLVTSFSGSLLGGSVPLFPWIPHVYRSTGESTALMVVIVVVLLALIGCYLSNTTSMPMMWTISRQMLVAFVSLSTVTTISAVLRWYVDVPEPM